ncbi:lactonase family protein [Paenibacillus pasadenensis]|uniref:lactonase family protein n=1 Tax=Paenibacillus pasadenensis TaxID=217090 RepID=UPI0020426BEA|nr:lactonase family protein [Paenibacillus pasadenensis]MCM3745832.1 lactonase family protein [Paenibacillus pasadenensis]
MTTPTTYVFAGSYAEPDGPGLYLYRWKEEALELELLAQADGLKNPTFLNVDAAGGKVYAISEGKNESGGKNGVAVSYRFQPETGTLERIGEAPTTDGPTCHIERSPDGTRLIVVSYHGGMAGLMELHADGSIGRRLDQPQHEGHSVNPERQDRPHPHSAKFSPDGKYVFVQDLGLDLIRTYKLENDRMVPVADNAVHPGAGPRHLAFHPNGKYAYVINEVDSSVSVLEYDPAAGALTELQHWPTLPAGFEGENTCAEIAVSEDGRFVYGSNRGHDSLVVFAVEEDGRKLNVIQHIPVEGKHPRHFALLPGGQYLLAASKDTNNIAVFRVDGENGKLTFTGRHTSVSQPVCVQPFLIG